MPFTKSWRVSAQALGVVAVLCGVGCRGGAAPEKKQNNKSSACSEHCGNGAQDCGETAVDCGGEDCGSCFEPTDNAACAGHCGNGEEDCNERGVDCGGECAPCTDECSGHCGNGVADCGESGADCGGECASCSDQCAGHCANDKLDCGELGTDCGGECTACPDDCANHCASGTQDCGESGPDCGGSCGACSVDSYPIMRGVSLAGAEFGESSMPGTYGQTYIYPTSSEIDHWIDLGMNSFRLPFRWERLQRSQYAAFDATEMGRIDAFVSHATDQGAYVVLDPHNYARYFNVLIGGGVPVAAFADFWGRLAEHFKHNPLVVFGIMNEPHTMSTEQWVSAANAAIAAIRAKGATNLVIVPGNAWSGAHSWLDNWYGTANGTAIKGIVDPLDNFILEVHQYFDANSGGVNMSTCVSNTIGSERLVAFTNWAKQNNMKAYLGEFGAGPSQTCINAIDDMLEYMDNHPDVWRGWAYWAAGPWWGNSVGNIEPQNGVDRPQTGALLEHVPSNNGM